jgi:hypothetical protein
VTKTSLRGRMRRLRIVSEEKQKFNLDKIAKTFQEEMGAR